ncbi:MULTISPECIES: hypothetical protein [Pseudomonas]|uniref:hypothetical protein n=1 Tax=Pseudomonas TaxID=286 RepID=UPI0028F403B2|nr:hypothetical protein [Pseudomonas sp. JV245A]
MPRFILPMLMWLTCLPAMADPARALQLLNYESPHHQPLEQAMLGLDRDLLDALQPE